MEKIYNTAEAAEELGIGTARMLQLIHSGRMGEIMLKSGGFLITESQLDLVRDRQPGRPGWVGKRKGE